MTLPKLPEPSWSGMENSYSLEAVLAIQEDAYRAGMAAERERIESALSLIATPMRPDGTWNRDREACRQLAEQALKEVK